MSEKRSESDNRQHFFNSPEGRAKAEAARKAKPAAKHNIRTVMVDLPGTNPSPAYAARAPTQTKKNHAQMAQAILRTENAVDHVFDFLQKLVARGSAILDQSAKTGHTPEEGDIRIIAEARTVALKFMDKTVPDLIAKGDGTRGQSINVVIGAPLARLTQRPTVIEVGGADGERTNGELHSESQRDPDPRQPGED